jgi:entericidin A
MKAITTASLVAFALLLAGCNTMHGFGQDVKKVGEKIEDKSKK